ncbi:BEL1-like homeodomain protein 4 [Populus alba x Populus x berolinensis]|nr:BEL1-like homeodomain protein 4 [Populus alba x Populus x berolinensis]
MSENFLSLHTLKLQEKKGNYKVVTCEGATKKIIERDDDDDHLQDIDMGIATTPPFPPILPHSSSPILQNTKSNPSNHNSMSQDYHQGIFTFSNGGFERSSVSHQEHNQQQQHQQQQHHIAQQIRRDKLRVQSGYDQPPPALLGIEEEESSGLPVYETAGINADSATAMQLFLMNPSQPRSPQSPSLSHHQPPPSTSSTLHMLLPNPSSSLQGFSTVSGGGFGATSVISPPQFTWVPDSSHVGGNTGAPLSNPTEISGVVEGQGLSLSLSSSLQHLEAAKAEELRMGDGGVGQNHHQVQVGFGSSLGVVNVLRNSKYVKAAQELLEEFCSVGRGQFKKSKFGRQNTNPSSNNNPGGGGGSSSSTKDLPPLSAADRIEHQRRKVDRRYNHYCEQMQMVVNSFDLVMGFGAAVPYTACPCPEAMSRHFRCLKDAIAAQLKLSCELLGEKDGAGTSGITKVSLDVVWSAKAVKGYPSDADKHLLARQTGLSRNQREKQKKTRRDHEFQTGSLMPGFGCGNPWLKRCTSKNPKKTNQEQKIEKGSKPTTTATIVGLHKHQRLPQQRQDHQHQLPQQQPSHQAKDPKINANENDPSLLAINRQCFSENQTKLSTSSSTTTTTIITPINITSATEAAPPPHAGQPFHDFADDTCRHGSIVTADYGTTSSNANAGGSTLIRFGTTTAGDVSLTLGLRHAGNMPEKSPTFSVRDFGGC